MEKRIGNKMQTCWSPVFKITVLDLKLVKTTCCGLFFYKTVFYKQATDLFLTCINRLFGQLEAMERCDEHNIVFAYLHFQKLWSNIIKSNVHSVLALFLLSTNS